MRENLARPTQIRIIPEEKLRKKAKECVLIISKNQVIHIH